MNRKRTSDEKEELIQRISQAEAKAQECQIEAAVYRRQLEKCERLARRAEKTNNPSLLYGVLSQASLTLKKRNVSEWGELWKEASNRDKRRLSEVRKALKEVGNLAEQMNVGKDSVNTRLKSRILECVRRVLA